MRKLIYILGIFLITLTACIKDDCKCGKIFYIDNNGPYEDTHFNSYNHIAAESKCGDTIIEPYADTSFVIGDIICK